MSVLKYDIIIIDKEIFKKSTKIINQWGLLIGVFLFGVFLIQFFLFWGLIGDFLIRFFMIGYG